jgi:uncharacterized LabA/DUF88 family protein
MSGKEAESLDVIVFVDYQNVMNDARRAFCNNPYSAHDGQIDPLRYAQRLVARTPLGTSGSRRLKQVRVYRGRPDPRRDPSTYAPHMRQCDAWEKAGVDVHPRPLRYPRDWPKSRAEEKGIDVQIALDVVTLGINGELDIAILCSTDTDLRPVVESYQVLDFPHGRPIIEAATWKSPHFSKKLSVPGVHLWSHFLHDDDYRHVCDKTDYNRS